MRSRLHTHDRGRSFVAAVLVAAALVIVFRNERAEALAVSSADTVWLSPGGSDDDAGTHLHPVRSLARAQEILRSRDKDADALVLIMSTRGVYVNQTVKWDYYRPGRSITLQAYPATANACFVASDADPPGAPFFALTVAPGEPTNIRLRNLTIRNYVSRPIYFVGDWSDDNRWNGGNSISGCCFHNIGNERMPDREVVYGVISFANSRGNLVENCAFIECANTQRVATTAEREACEDLLAVSAERAAEMMLPIVGVYIAYGSTDNVVTGCTMRRLKGDGIRIRDNSDRTIIQYCNFCETGWSAPCTMWYCDCASQNCIKPSLECHSVDNRMLYNHLEGGWGCAQLPIYADLVPRIAQHCASKGNAPKLSIIGNTTAPCLPAGGSKSDPDTTP